MSLNSYATPDGLEIGRAQAMQAEASGISCRVEMNPVLLKPTSNTQSQVVLNGKPIGVKSASEYFMDTDRDAFVITSYSIHYTKLYDVCGIFAGILCFLSKKKAPSKLGACGLDGTRTRDSYNFV